MGLNLDYTDGRTPIDEDEKEGLLIKTISTLGELDEFEQLNVEKAVEWTLKRKLDYKKILTEDFVKELHKRMFSDVWKWAGDFRTSNKNIGADKFQIGIMLKDLLDDCKYWIEHKTFSEDEIAVRFSHRIVSIHPFSNGNGRHSRLIADILVSNGLSKLHFTWGSKNLTKKGEARSKYLNALKEADGGDYKLLIEFARE
ncbi:MAG: mobile mystery protein b [Stygiobacter sp.]|nr:MAG: mobile mystery protein b [Stygiobacter sp.]KAF0217929.1 MAG: mobile mystery protein [Ignavibacteria bacterium]